MAGNVQLYTLAYVTINNALLTEHASVEFKRMGGAQVVGTVAKGFAGVSPGMQTCQINVTNAVPAADFEYDAGDAISQYIPVEIGVVGPGGKVAKVTGFIMDDDFKHSLNAESQYSFQFTGSFPVWE